MRERIAFRLAVLRLFPYGGTHGAACGIVLQLLAGLMPVAFIVATSASSAASRAPCVHGLDSPEWRSLRNVLIVAGVLFVVAADSWADAVHGAVHARVAGSTTGCASARRARRSAPSASRAIEEPEIYDTLADLSDAERGTGFSPGSACWGDARCCSRCTCSGRSRPS